MERPPSQPPPPSDYCNFALQPNTKISLLDGMRIWYSVFGNTIDQYPVAPNLMSIYKIIIFFLVVSRTQLHFVCTRSVQQRRQMHRMPPHTQCQHTHVCGAQSKYLVRCAPDRGRMVDSVIGAFNGAKHFLYSSASQIHRCSDCMHSYYYSVHRITFIIIVHNAHRCRASPIAECAYKMDIDIFASTPATAR